MHIACHINKERGNVQFLVGDRDIAGVDLSELAHVVHGCTDAPAGAVRFLEHLFLLVGERPALLLQQHAEVAADHRDRGSELMDRQRHGTSERVV